MQRDRAHTSRVIEVKSAFLVPILPKFTFLLVDKVICQAQFQRKSFIIAQNLRIKFAMAEMSQKQEIKAASHMAPV